MVCVKIFKELILSILNCIFLSCHIHISEWITLYGCQNVKELFAWSRCKIWISNCSINWSVWPNGWVFINELSGCGFEASCSHLKFRFHTCFEQGVPRHSCNYIVVIGALRIVSWFAKWLQKLQIYVPSSASPKDVSSRIRKDPKNGAIYLKKSH